MANFAKVPMNIWGASFTAKIPTKLLMELNESDLDSALRLYQCGWPADRAALKVVEIVSYRLSLATDLKRTTQR